MCLAEDYEEEEEYNDIDDVDNDDGQFPDAVVADDILPGLLFLF